MNAERATSIRWTPLLRSIPPERRLDFLEARRKAAEVLMEQRSVLRPGKTQGETPTTKPQ